MWPTNQLTSVLFKLQAVEEVAKHLISMKNILFGAGGNKKLKLTMNFTVLSAFAAYFDHLFHCYHCVIFDIKSKTKIQLFLGGSSPDK